eukprot:2806459-Amphidinium_carterae.1
MPLLQNEHLQTRGGRCAALLLIFLSAGLLDQKTVALAAQSGVTCTLGTVETLTCLTSMMHAVISWENVRTPPGRVTDAKSSPS